MREHLYRAKCVNWKELPKENWWVQGYLMNENYINIPLNNEDVWGRYDEQIEVDPETTCEYTGKTDKNGRKIFEGNIVKRTDLHDAKEPSVGFIEYDAENTAFLIHWTDVQNYSATFPWKDRIEVIGNIYDNPELLKEATT